VRLYLALAALCLAGACDSSGSDDRIRADDVGTAITVGATPDPITPVRFGACGRLFVYGVTSDGSTAIALTFDVPAGDLEQTYQLPDPSVRAEVVSGHDVANTFCDDTTANSNVETASAVSSGTIGLSVAAGQVHVTVDDLVVADGTELALDSITSAISPMG
jgi:hypothetical protein